MADLRFVAVIDIGKTNAKVVVFDLATKLELERLSTANAVLHAGLYPHYNTDALWQFIVESLKALNQRHRIDAISIATHGASAALLDEAGTLALPVLDYEHDGPQSVSSEYDATRPLFAETGSPRLPNGLNLGAQIFWQAKTYPKQFAYVRWIVTYPQYWAFRLCGVLANEATSLGCHTDLWDYEKSDYSSLVDRMGWRVLMPAVREASDCLGTLLPQIVRETGLNSNTPIHCGIHDSNASLLPHLLGRKKPFAVVSTGTWVISMAIGGRRLTLDPARDTLVNVNAFGDPVPSARFMGGREFELMQPHFGDAPTDADEDAVLKNQAMLLPSVVQGCGPYPKHLSRWLNDGGITPSQRQVAVSFYLALMTASCLDLAGAEGDIIVEGPFASNVHFRAMLAAATDRTVSGTSAATGTALGAALLCAPIALELAENRIAVPFSVAHKT
ncbi:MAG: FGGY-family carbohydrate kinase, partial [Aestuariivirga sp.]